MDETIIDRINELNGTTVPDGNAANFNLFVDDVSALERKFIAALSVGNISDPINVSTQLAALGAKATAAQQDTEAVTA